MSLRRYTYQKYQVKWAEKGVTTLLYYVVTRRYRRYTF